MVDSQPFQVDGMTRCLAFTENLKGLAKRTIIVVGYCIKVDGPVHPTIDKWTLAATRAQPYCKRHRCVRRN